MLYRQKMCKLLGDEGCYFLSLLYIAEGETGRRYDALGTLWHFICKGYVGEDCYVREPAALLSELTGKPCTVRKSWDFGYRLAANEREVRCFKRDAGGKTFWHFVVADSEGNVEHDPLGESNTVKFGEAESRRILTIGGQCE